jgi:hypothetical protein
MAAANWKSSITSERFLRRALIAIAALGLAAGSSARLADHPDLADALWSAATVPVAAGLAPFRL